MNLELRPNLFVIGAMKAATSSLHWNLHAHPEVFMSNPKEPSYFVEHSQLIAEHPVIERMGFWKGEKYYLALFKDAGEARIIGESSTAYTKLPNITGVTHRIIEFSPEARLVYIMRDPVERTISHYWHNRRWLSETRGMLEAIQETPFYRQVSHYAMQLEPYLNFFSKSQIKILTYEQLKSNSIPVLQDLYAWLGVNSNFVPALEKHNVTPEAMHVPRGLGILYWFRHTWIWDIVGPRLPKTIRSLGRRFSDRKIERLSEPQEDVLKFLRPIHRKETLELQKMLGRDFPEWTTLFST